jgi:hypothetical protein
LTLFEQALQQYGSAFPCLSHVHVRIRPIRYQSVGIGQHALGYIGVEIQAGDNRHRRADHPTQPREQFSFAVVEVLTHHGAVEIQVNPVEVP